MVGHVYYNDIYSLSTVAVCIHTYTTLLPNIHTFRGHAWLMPIDMLTDGTKISSYQYFSVEFYLLNLHFFQGQLLNKNFQISDLNILGSRTSSPFHLAQ